MGGSFNTREFFHGKSQSFMSIIKPTFLILVFLIPLILLFGGVIYPSLFIFAFLSQYIGLLVERWYFFAQANHPQNLYYQAIG